MNDPPMNDPVIAFLTAQMDDETANLREAERMMEQAEEKREAAEARLSHLRDLVGRHKPRVAPLSPDALGDGHMGPMTPDLPNKRGTSIMDMSLDQRQMMFLRMIDSEGRFLSRADFESLLSADSYEATGEQVKDVYKKLYDRGAVVMVRYGTSYQFTAYGLPEYADLDRQEFTDPKHEPVFDRTIQEAEPNFFLNPRDNEGPFLWDGHPYENDEAA